MTAPRIAAFMAFAFALSSTAQAQSDPSNILEPPAEHLARLQPFLGAYDQTMDYAGQE